MTRNAYLLLFLVIFTVALFIISFWSGVFVLFVEIIAAAFYFHRPQCPKCGARGQIVNAGSQEVGRVNAFDIFDRKDTTSTRYFDNQGNPSTARSTTYRQERAPSIRVTYRTFYECKNCHNRTYSDSVKVYEDFSRSGNEVTKEIYNTKVVEREVLKVPCKYCRSLIDPVTNTYCPSCGGRLL